MPVKVLYDPIVDADKWEFDSVKNEIKITSIDPQETAYMVVFPSRDQVREFIRPRVIIGDQLLNNSMQRYGYIKKYPWKIMTLSSGVLTVLLLLAIPGISFYKDYQYNQDITFIESNLKSWEPWSWALCQATVSRGNDINEKKIRGNRMHVDSILQINQVHSIDQLLQKEQIIICK